MMMTMQGSAPLPPDRGHLSTEQQHAGSIDLDAQNTRECITLFADDHRRVVEAIHAARDSLAMFIDELVPRLRRGGRLMYLGAGTSGRLGVLDASECPPTFQSPPGQIVGLIAGGDAALRRSSEGMEDDADGARSALEELKLNERDTVLGIAAGGTTPYVLGGLRIAKVFGAMTGFLTNVHRDLPERCDHLIVLDTGAELLTGSTRLKAGSATKLALNIITTTAFIQLGKSYGNLMVDLRATNDKLTDRALRILRAISPELNRESALHLLRDAGGEVKTAAVMERLGVDAVTARRVLAEHDGHLRAVIGPPRESTAR